MERRGVKAKLPHYRCRGARALVLLHDAELRPCLATWRRAKVLNVMLPETTDEDYSSLEHLLVHILGAARGYMVWMCKQLELPDSGIRPAPGAADVKGEAEDDLEHAVMHPIWHSFQSEELIAA